MAIFAHSLYVFYAIFFLIGASISASAIGIQNIVWVFSSLEERSTYIALTNTVISPFLALAPLLGGVLIDKLSYTFVFGLSAFIASAAASVVVFTVREPNI